MAIWGLSWTFKNGYKKCHNWYCFGNLKVLNSCQKVLKWSSKCYLKKIPLSLVLSYPTTFYKNIWWTKSRCIFFMERRDCLLLMKASLNILSIASSSSLKDPCLMFQFHSMKRYLLLQLSTPLWGKCIVKVKRLTIKDDEFLIVSKLLQNLFSLNIAKQ